MPLTSQLFQGDAALEAAANIDSAHITPGASGPHVAKIQKALNILDNARLTIDGVYGPATANAVLNYKTKRNIVNRSYETKADNIVGRMTIAALDAEMAANENSGSDIPIVGFSRHFSCKHTYHEDKRISAGESDIEPANPKLVALAVAMVPTVRVVIRETRFLLTAAGPFIQDHQKLKEPEGFIDTAARKCIHLLINVFSLDQLADPLAGYDNIVRVFRNMDAALNRTFGVNLPNTPALFVPNTHKSMEVDLAYTAPGGAFFEPGTKWRKLQEPVDRIYICSQFAGESHLFQVGILIHELAHFVSGRPILINHGHGVPERGLMLVDRAPFDRIQPAIKLKSPEHYAFFALAAGLKASGL